MRDSKVSNLSSLMLCAVFWTGGNENHSYCKAGRVSKAYLVFTWIGPCVGINFRTDEHCNSVHLQISLRLSNAFYIIPLKRPAKQTSYYPLQFATFFGHNSIFIFLCKRNCERDGFFRINITAAKIKSLGGSLFRNNPNSHQLLNVLFKQ